MIKSISEDQGEILEAIKGLHLNGKGYQCDITYGNGIFWKGRKEPRMKFDIEPLRDGVTRADSRDLPIKDGILDNIVFDPPFLTYIRSGRKHGSIMGKRFGGYWRLDELEEHYKGTLAEVERVLRSKGILVMKCQDIIHNHKMHSTHVNVINWAMELGLVLIDTFILIARNRMAVKTKMNSNNWKQRHARIFHSYFLVFEKSTCKKG